MHLFWIHQYMNVILPLLHLILVIHLIRNLMIFFFNNNGSNNAAAPFPDFTLNVPEHGTLSTKGQAPLTLGVRARVQENSTSWNNQLKENTNTINTNNPIN
eukprot:334847_1